MRLAERLRPYGRTGGLKTQQYSAMRYFGSSLFLMQKQAVACLALCEPTVRF